MQKKSMKKLKRPNSLFLQGEVSSAVLKTWKTGETKTWITQNFQILYHIQGTTIGKLTSWGFRKCGSFCPGEFLKRSYWLSKSSNFSIFFESKMRCQKKDTATILIFRACHGISVGPNMWGPRWFSGDSEKSKLWPCLFFLTPPNFGDTSTFADMIWLWPAITPVKKLARPKSTTFSESSGSQLSHGPILEKFPHQKISMRMVFSKAGWSKRPSLSKEIFLGLP